MITIKEAYDLYTAKYSIPEMAISLELAEYLDTLLNTQKPKSILDLGSGFSTFVFARYQALNPEANIYIQSIDTNAEWLEKTKAFLAEALDGIKYNIDFMACNDSIKLFPGQIDKFFDLVLYDIGETQFRLKNLELALQCWNQKSDFIIDDWHCSDFREAALKQLEGREIINLEDKTKDKFGRYAISLAPRIQIETLQADNAKQLAENKTNMATPLRQKTKTKKGAWNK